jgi:hypothetical protein
MVRNSRDSFAKKEKILKDIFAKLLYLEVKNRLESGFPHEFLVPYIKEIGMLGLTDNLRFFIHSSEDEIDRALYPLPGKNNVLFLLPHLGSRNFQIVELFSQLAEIYQKLYITVITTGSSLLFKDFAKLHRLGPDLGYNITVSYPHKITENLIDEIQDGRKRGHPYVWFNADRVPVSCPVITNIGFPQEEAAEKLVKNLTALFPRNRNINVFYLGGPQNWYHSKPRDRGISRASESLHNIIRIDDSKVHIEGWLANPAQERVNKELRKGEPFDLIIAADEDFVYPVIRAYNDFGVSFSNLPIIATIEQTKRGESARKMGLIDASVDANGGIVATANELFHEVMRLISGKKTLKRIEACCIEPKVFLNPLIRTHIERVCSRR